MNPNNSWSTTSQWGKLSNNPPQTQTPQTSFAQDESRDMMIKRLYNTILGREADTAGLNYYLYNTQISESEIAKDMYQSTEHLEIISKAKDIRKMVADMEENLKKVSDTENEMKNVQTLNDNYKVLIEQKTQMINELRARLGDDVELSSETAKPTEQNAENQYEDLILDDPFEHEGKERRGVIGWIRNLFS